MRYDKQIELFEPIWWQPNIEVQFFGHFSFFARRYPIYLFKPKKLNSEWTNYKKFQSNQTYYKEMGAFSICTTLKETPYRFSQSLTTLSLFLSHFFLAHFMVAAFHSAFPSPIFIEENFPSTFHSSFFFWRFWTFFKKVAIVSHRFFTFFRFTDTFGGFSWEKNHIFYLFVSSFRLSTIYYFSFFHTSQLFPRWKFIFHAFHTALLALSILFLSHILSVKIFHWGKLSFSFVYKKTSLSVFISIYINVRSHELLFSLNVGIMDRHKNFCQWIFPCYLLLSILFLF